MRGLSTEAQLCGRYRLESLVNYMGAIVMLFLGASAYITTEHICARAGDKSVCMGSSALGQSQA